MKSIAVIGVIPGITTVYAFVKQAFSVKVFLPCHTPAMAISIANGGQLSAVLIKVWKQQTTIYKELQLMWRSQAPRLLNLIPFCFAQLTTAIFPCRTNTVGSTRYAALSTTSAVMTGLDGRRALTLRAWSLACWCSRLSCSAAFSNSRLPIFIFPFSTHTRSRLVRC